jgi:hypothetical protein
MSKQALKITKQVFKNIKIDKSWSFSEFGRSETAK